LSGERDAGFHSLWRQASPWRDYLRPEMQSYQLWRGVFDHVTIPEWAREELSRSPLRKLLVLAADWCGDAANSVPVLAAFIEEPAESALRILERDRFPEVMSGYLTNGTRSIPIAIALDEEYRELTHWGPRPAPLQTWMLANRAMVPSPQRYAYARRWYAKDRGETLLWELLDAVSGSLPTIEL
jgi:Thioredoxin